MSPDPLKGCPLGAWSGPPPKKKKKYYIYSDSPICPPLGKILKETLTGIEMLASIVIVVWRIYRNRNA